MNETTNKTKTKLDRKAKDRIILALRHYRDVFHPESDTCLEIGEILAAITPVDVVEFEDRPGS